MLRHNAGSKIIMIPGDAVRVTHPAAAAIIPWYLSGGISAANCIAAYQPKGAANLAASKVNLANPGTYDAAAGSDPSFDTSYGWSFNGTSQYLTTGIVPLVNQTWSAIVRFTDFAQTGFNALFGSSHAGGKGFIIARTASYYYYNGGALNIATPLADGVSGFAGNKGYRNGVAETGTIGTDGTNIYDIYIGTFNNVGSPTFGAGNTKKIQAFAIYDTVLTSTQMGLLSTAMAAL